MNYIIYCGKPLVIVEEFVIGSSFSWGKLVAMRGAWLPCSKVKKSEIFDEVNWLLCNSEKGLGVWALNQSAGRADTQKYERAA